MDTTSRQIEDEARAEIASDPRIPHPAEIAVEVVDGIATLRGTVAGELRNVDLLRAAAPGLVGVPRLVPRVHRQRLVPRDRALGRELADLDLHHQPTEDIVSNDELRFDVEEELF
jgi:hypothetical protein